MMTGRGTSSRSELQIKRGDALRLPGSFSRIRVMQGVAWVTIDGEDIVLERGEQAAVEGDVVISGLQDQEVIVEAWSAAALAA